MILRQLSFFSGGAMGPAASVMTFAPSADVRSSALRAICPAQGMIVPSLSSQLSPKFTATIRTPEAATVRMASASVLNVAFFTS